MAAKKTERPTAPPNRPWPPDKPEEEKKVQPRYVILQTAAPVTLAFEVNKALEEGAELAGGPFMDQNAYARLYCQAVLYPKENA